MFNEVKQVFQMMATKSERFRCRPIPRTTQAITTTTTTIIIIIIIIITTNQAQIKILHYTEV
jgi:hypothetical protein